MRHALQCLVNVIGETIMNVTIVVIKIRADFGTVGKKDIDSTANNIEKQITCQV